ncbi:hypothetical protein ACIBI4_19340 [Streptomyces sp. NPDC050418]|uniref:hypothetical protein n=1 Tax=Streptomyces sp. NPDC050418 TaxID=3365612 RepID=UPI00379E0001
MSAQLYPAAKELAKVLWQQHTLYRERDGGMVIRGEHVQRWISLGVAGTRGDVRIRAGLILDGGTTAPARTETVVPLAAGTQELAAACRRLLADLTSAAEPPTDTRPPREARGPKPPKRPKAPKQPKARRSRGRRAVTWVLAVAAVSAATLYALASYSAAIGG